MTTENKLKEIVQSVLTDYQVKLATGKSLESFIATEEGRKSAFISFDGIGELVGYESSASDGIVENYRIYIVADSNIQSVARTLYAYFQDNEYFTADNIDYTVFIGSGYFDNTFSQSVYIQNLQVQG